MHLVCDPLPRPHCRQGRRHTTRRLIGIGNPDRGDDAAGWEVAGRVTNWSIERRTAGSFDLVNTWKDDDDVVIVDAMRSGDPPGTIAWFDARQERVPSCVFSSTHSFGPMAISELARSLDRMPRTLFVVGIEIEHTDHGAPMSPPVALAVSRLAMELQHARGKIGTGSRLSDRPGG